MHRTLRHFAVAALLAGSTTGCSDFLQGPTVDVDPNNPSLETTSDNSIFSGFQSVAFANYGPTIAMFICGWVQQCKGVNGRFVEQQLTLYQLDPGTVDLQFIQLYAAGGLNDLRTLRGRLNAKGDRVWVGITKAWEALIISEAADKWGDIPYAEAANPDILEPRLDDQLAIYNTLLTLLDEAIGDVNSGAGPGPGVADFIYGGDAASWVAFAHTLKARILLHRARVDCGATLNGCAAYAAIAAEAAQGIQQGGADFNAVVSGANALESNTWFAFYNFSGFGSDLRASDTLVAEMANRLGPGVEDPRFDAYFVIPSEAGQDPDLDAEGPLLRISFTTTSPADRPQPWVTADENTFITAEAQLHSGNSAGALVSLNVIRTKYGLPALGAFGPDPLSDIMEEKWITLIENPEVWNDYKRTCLPAFRPTSNQGPIVGLIPRRFFYGQTELDNNRNIPSGSGQLGNGGTQLDGTPVNLGNFRNKNDPPPPVGCTPLTF